MTFLAQIIALIVGLGVVVPAPTDRGQHDEHTHAAQSEQAKMGQMGMCGAMEEMMATMTSNTERIQTLMSRINTTSGDEKVSAMADLLAILVEERNAMQKHCAEMMAPRK